MKPKWRATRYVIMLCSSGAHLTAAHKFGCAICAHIANETDFDVASRPHKSLAFAAGPTGRSVQVFFLVLSWTLRDASTELRASRTNPLSTLL